MSIDERGTVERLLQEYDRPPEFIPRVYGEKVTRPVAVGQLILLSQTRPDLNPQIHQLRESIGRTDIINQPDIAVLARGPLEAYIDFVNRIWGASHSIEECEADEFGNYYLVVAGHSRVQAIRMNEEMRRQHAHAEGYSEYDPNSALVVCKIHEAMTPNDIISLQLDENLHSQPPAERTAMAIVETYLYGLENGAWSTQSEFLRYGENKFSKYALTNALAFAELPRLIRDFVFLGGIPYLAGVEMSKTMPTLRTYLLKKYWQDRAEAQLTEDEVREFEAYILEWLGSEVGTLQRSKLSATAAKKRYKELREKDLVVEVDKNQGSLDLVMADPMQAWKQARRRLREKYKATLLDLSDDKLSKVAQTLSIHAQLFDPDGSEHHEVIDLLARKTEEFARKLGSNATAPSLLIA